MNLNRTMAGYFESHPGVNEFWFCSDGLAFFNGASAQAHAAALKKAGKSDAIQAVTRDAVTAWWATYAPQYAATCAADLITAQTALTAAQSALTGLAAKTPFSKKASYIKAVNDAKKRVNVTQATLDKANTDAAYVADKAALNAAENKLKTDAAVTETTAAVLEADKAAVDAATAKAGKDLSTALN